MQKLAIAGAVLIVLILMLAGPALKYFAPGSDFQRLNAVEARLDALECVPCLDFTLDPTASACERCIIK